MSSARYLKMVEKEIREFQFDSAPGSLYDPIHYMMRLEGKRLRPLMTMLSYSLYKEDVQSIARYAAAVEAFHNFTLMHDDIMDQAPLRRGKITVHKKWNVNTGILSGDVLLVKVYERFLELEGRPLEQVLKLFNACATAICEGQQWDMDFEKAKRVTEEEYLKMIELKTGTLLGFSLELGALLAGAPAKDQNVLRQLGIDLGIAFQLKDDLLDAFGDKRKFGKQQGGDIISNKKTYLLIKALDRSKGQTSRELQRWLSAKKFDKRKKVTGVTRLFNELGIRGLTEKKIENYIVRVFQSLEQLGNTVNTEPLRRLIEELSTRQK